MRKILLFVFLFLIACGGTEAENTISQDSFDSSNKDTTTTTVRDTTTTTVKDTTTTIASDTTSAKKLKNKCDDCEYLTISDLISNLDNVPRFAWNDYQRIAIENNVFENSFFEIILNVGPSTNLYFEDNEKYIQKGISFWQYFNLPEKYYAFFYNFDDLDWAVFNSNNTIPCAYF